jgi:ribonuclease BN (tRNA processing enzyme)
MFHDVTPSTFSLGSVQVAADMITHPGSTLGYRITEGDKSIAYLSDHEPAFGAGEIPKDPDWVSGFSLSHSADVLIHDAQYTDEEYNRRIGWGHTSLTQLGDFARLVEARRLDIYHDELRSLLNGVELLPGAPELEITV